MFKCGLQDYKIDRGNAIMERYEYFGSCIWIMQHVRVLDILGARSHDSLRKCLAVEYVHTYPLLAALEVQMLNHSHR